MSLLSKKIAGVHENASTQINVPKGVADQIIRIGRELIPEEHLAGEGRVEQPHITVKYGVDPQEQVLRQTLAAYTTFPVELGKVVVFVGEKNNAGGTPVVVEVHGDELAELHRAVMEAMGTLPDDHAYTPHITIAYIKPEEAQHYAGDDSFGGIGFDATQVALSPFDDSKQVEIPLAKAAAASAPVMPEIPEVTPEMDFDEEEEPEEEEVQRDEPATPAKRPQPKKQPKNKLLAPKPSKAPKKPPTQTTNFKKWFGKSKVRDEDGAPLRVYHGTTHNFEAFDPSKGNAENYYGKALYFTSDTADVGENYATQSGPDLTSRVDHRSEQIMQEWEDQWDDLKDELGLGDIESFPMWSSVEDSEYKRVQDKAKTEARKEIAGDTGGMTMPVYLSIQNPVIVQKQGGTYFNLEISEDGEESGNGVEFYNAMMLVANNCYSGDAQELWGEISENMEFTAYDFEMQTRNGNHYFEDGEGNQAAGSFIAQVYQEMGFDGIIQDANEAFGSGSRGKGMTMEWDTKHYILWDPTKVKSAIGNPGKFDPKNPNITAAGRTYPGTPEWIAKAKAFMKEKWAERHTEMGREGVPTDMAGACKFASLLAQQLFNGQIKGNPEHQVLKRGMDIIDLTDLFDPNAFYHDKEWFGNPEHEESMASCMPRVQQWAEEFRQKYPLPSVTAAAGDGYPTFEEVMDESTDTEGEFMFDELADAEEEYNETKAFWSTQTFPAKAYRALALNEGKKIR